MSRAPDPRDLMRRAVLRAHLTADSATVERVAVGSMHGRVWWTNCTTQGASILWRQFKPPRISLEVNRK